MKKLFTALLLVTALIIGMFSAVGAQAYDITVQVDGRQVVFPDQKPFINENDRSLVPIRFIAEDMEADVDWDANKKLVTINKESTVIELTIGEKCAKVNGSWKTFDTNAVIVGDRTMVPLRFISEALGADVDWDGKSRIVYIWTGKVPRVPISSNGKTTKLIETDIQRLRSYPFSRETNDFLSFEDYFNLDNGYSVNFAIEQTTKILGTNWYRGAEYYPNAVEIRFYTEPATVYRQYQDYSGVRGILQIRYKGPNKDGLEPGKLYERDMEYRGCLSALDPKTIGWRIDFVVPLSDYKEVKE